MKKTIFTLTVTLFVGALTGMEQQPSYGSLPKELKQNIISNALETSDTLDKAIRTIQTMGIIHGIQYDNFKNVINLVTALENKFPNKSREEIVQALDNQELLKTFKQLLSEHKHEIIKMAIASGTGVEETIEAIKVASVLQGMHYDKLFDNLTDLTKLIHILSDKFDVTTQYIAELVGTPTATEYIELGKNLLSDLDQLLENVGDNDSVRIFSDHIIQLVNNGADVNFSTYDDYYEGTPLDTAIQRVNIEGIKLLLKLGVVPTNDNTVFSGYLPNDIQQMLKVAMKTKKD